MSLARDVVPGFDGSNFDISPRIQHNFYKALLPRLAPFSLVEALLKRFRLRKWFPECELLHVASKAANLFEEIHNHVPPCVLFAAIKTFFNGLATSARFQKMAKVCLLCSDCNGEDSLEHYAVCEYQWVVFVDKFKTSVFPQSLARFLGICAIDLNDRVFHAAHMYAVMVAHNSRKHSGIIIGPDEMQALVWQGHRVAQLHHKGLEKRYKSIWHNATSSSPHISRTNAGDSDLDA